jgi:hypothetical protein
MSHSFSTPLDPLSQGTRKGISVSSTINFCAACSVLPLISVKGSPMIQMPVPSTVATNPRGLAMRSSTAIALPVRGDGHRSPRVSALLFTG